MTTAQEKALLYQALVKTILRTPVAVPPAAKIINRDATDASMVKSYSSRPEFVKSSAPYLREQKSHKLTRESCNGHCIGTIAGPRLHVK